MKEADRTLLHSPLAWKSKTHYRNNEIM